MTYPTPDYSLFVFKSITTIENVYINKDVDTKVDLQDNLAHAEAGADATGNPYLPIPVDTLAQTLTLSETVAGWSSSAYSGSTSASEFIW